MNFTSTMFSTSEQCNLTQAHLTMAILEISVFIRRYTDMLVYISIYLDGYGYIPMAIPRISQWQSQRYQQQNQSSTFLSQIRSANPITDDVDRFPKDIQRYPDISVYISKYRDISQWQSQRYQQILSMMLIVFQRIFFGPCT